MSYDNREFVLMIKAISDETRLRIVDMLSCEEMCACKLLAQFKITQPTLSYHMKILTECGIVIGRREGAWMHYRLNGERGKQLVSFITQLLSEEKPVSSNACTCKE